MKLGPHFPYTAYFCVFFRFLESSDYFFASVNGFVCVTKAQRVTVSQKLDSHPHIETYV
jgi:hypothetical protein